MLMGHELRKKRKYKSFLEDLQEYHRKFLEFHKRKYGILRKKAYNAKAYLEWLGRRE